MSRVKPPDSPGARFSCSPRMWARSPVRSSASETASASLLATLKVTSPAGILAGLGAQPCCVRATVTVLVLPDPDPDPDPLPEACGPALAHPAAASASGAMTAAVAVRWRSHPRLPSVLTLGTPQLVVVVDVAAAAALT